MLPNRMVLVDYLRPLFQTIAAKRLLDNNWEISIQLYPNNIPPALSALGKETDFPILVSNHKDIWKTAHVYIFRNRIEYRSRDFTQTLWQQEGHPDDALTILKKKVVADEYMKFELWFREYLQEITLKYLGERLRIVDL